MTYDGADPTVYTSIAHELETLAKRYRLKAADLQATIDTHTKAQLHVDACFSSSQVLENFLTSGLPYEAALDAASAQTGIIPETIAYHWKKALHARKNDTSGGRAIEVVRLAAKGWTNAEIGKELGIHPNSVSRIISKKIRHD
jgi:DNA-binding NarL/FixJ family response regulator